MTLGQKIRYYRKLKQMTLKELGELVLEDKKNSDTRMGQYEKDLMAPKADIRRKIARALDIDEFILTDHNLTTTFDVMSVLFELEETHGLKIKKNDGKVIFEFDENCEANSRLLPFLFFWEEFYSLNGEDPDRKMQYELWKGRFETNIKEYLNDKMLELQEKYDPIVKQKVESKVSLENTTEMVGLLRKISDSGITVSIRTDPEGRKGISFSVKDLLNITGEAEDLFAQFMAGAEILESKGAEMFYTAFFNNESPEMIYFSNLEESMNVVTERFLEYLAFKKRDDRSDYVNGFFEKEFNQKLSDNCIVFDDEISKLN